MDSLNPDDARPGAVRQPPPPTGGTAGSRTRVVFSELWLALAELRATLDELDRALEVRTAGLPRPHAVARPAPMRVDLAA